MALVLTMLATTLLTVVTGPAPALAASYFAIKNYKSKMYLQPDGNFNVGTVIKQYPPQAGGYQEWRWVADGAYDSLMSNLSLKNMGIDRGTTAPYAFAILANPSGAWNQDWEVTETFGIYRFQNRNSGLCLGINGGSTAAGAAAIQAPCDLVAANQQWQIIFW